jgi:DNA-binding transcriptional MerR regulator
VERQIVYRPSEAASRLGIPPSTLRLYAARFADLLSSAAGGGAQRDTAEGRHRRYTPEDLAVLAEIRRLLAAGLSSELVRLQLGGGQQQARLSFPDGSSLPSAGRSIRRAPRASRGRGSGARLHVGESPGSGGGEHPGLDERLTETRRWIAEELASVAERLDQIAARLEAAVTGIDMLARRLDHLDRRLDDLERVLTEGPEEAAADASWLGRLLRRTDREPRRRPGGTAGSREAGKIFSE